MDISFIFRLDDDPATYYGKMLCGYFSDDHNGIDRMVKAELRNAVNKYRRTFTSSTFYHDVERIYVGILGTTTEWSSSKERFMFDIYINQMYTNVKKHSFTYEGKKMYYYEDHESDSDEDDVESDDDDVESLIDDLDEDDDEESEIDENATHPTLENVSSGIDIDSSNKPAIAQQ